MRPCDGGNFVLDLGYTKDGTMYEFTPDDIKKIQKQFKPIKAEVVALADKVENLALGDEVTLNPQARPQTMVFDWNNDSLAKVRHRHSVGQALVGVGMVKFSEYLLYDEFDVVGVILKN